MKAHSLTRRDLLRGSVALAALAFARHPLSAFGFPEPENGATVLPFLDKQSGKNGIQWENLSNWFTPNPDVYIVKHYNQPSVDPATWQLELGGLVKNPAKFRLADLKSRRRKTVTAILECSGNNASAGFMGAVANVRWTGTPLAPLLRDAVPFKRGIEVGFFGADGGKEEDRNKKEYAANFSRGLHVVDAMRDDILLCYEMNDEPLTPAHGAPVRLVVPGWFGIAWVKWLQRVEVLDRRVMSKYMAREYVTVRGEERGDKTTWRETSIGPILIKSMIARAEKLHDGRILLRGAAWTDGTPLAQVDLKIDDGPWQGVNLERTPRSKFGWTFWTFDWGKPAPGEHKLVCRAMDAEGRAQPTAEDGVIKLKRTYWEANQQWPRRIQIDG